MCAGERTRGRGLCAQAHTSVHYTFRVRVAVDGRRGLSLKRAHEEYAFADFYALPACSNARERASARVYGTPGREAFDPDRGLLTMLFESVATKASVSDSTRGVR